MTTVHATPVFQLNAVSYTYPGGHPALAGVDLAIGPGEHTVVLGANGSGKSTLLMLLDGLLRPDSGTMEAFGEDITGAADDLARARWLHQRVGLVFQDADVQLFSPTVWDDVAFGPLQMGWSATEVRRRVEQVLATMGVAGLASRAPYELSEGEKKRVAIATVLAVDPEVLLLDEPTANLDPRSKAVLINLIADLGRGGKTIVITTQELEIAPLVATRAVVLGDRERRPVAEGPLADVLADTELLVRTNLIHEHLHSHVRLTHSHPHGLAGHHP